MRTRNKDSLIADDKKGGYFFEKRKFAEFAIISDD